MERGDKVYVTKVEEKDDRYAFLTVDNTIVEVKKGDLIGSSFLNRVGGSTPMYLIKKTPSAYLLLY